MLILCLILTCHNLADAQFGVKTGVTASSFYYSGSVSPVLDYLVDLRPFLGYDIEFAQLAKQNPLLSLYLSTYYDFQLSPRFGIQPGLTYTQKGVVFSDFTYERLIYKVKISYIEIPLSLFYQFIQKENSIATVYMGGYSAFKTKATKDITYHNNPAVKTPIKTVKAFEGGLHFGATYKRKISEHFFLLDFRVFMGLSDLFSLPDDWTNIYLETQKTKTTGLNLSIGYEF